MNRMFIWLLWPSIINRRRSRFTFSFINRSKTFSSQFYVELRGHVSVSFAISTSHPDLSYIKPECPRHLHRTRKSIYYLFLTGYEPGLLKSFTALYLLSGCVYNKQTFNQFHISPPSQPSSRYFEYLFSLEEAESLGTGGNSWKCGG